MDLLPPAAYGDHARLMFDLQVLAFQGGPGSIELLWFADRALAHEPL